MNASRNPFDIFPSAPGLIPQFGMNQSLMSPYSNPHGFPSTSSGLNLSHSPISSKKVKQQPIQSSAQSDFLQMGSKFCNVPPLLPTTLNTSKERSQNLLNIAEPPSNILPLQQQINATFDQLLKDQQVNPVTNSTPAKRPEMETFDLTKDSSPEPPNPTPVASTSVPNVPIQLTSPEPPPMTIMTEGGVVKEKSKEKKKKKDKDKEERKKVGFLLIFNCIGN